MDLPKFTEKLVEYLSRLSDADAEVARIIGVDRSQILRWRKGVIPKLESLLKLISKLELETDELTRWLRLAGDEYPDLSSILALTKLEQIDIGKYLDEAVREYEMDMWALHGKKSEPQQPYKFLYAYEAGDSEIFFGRDDAISALHKVVLNDRLTIVHAKSGAGKTSLLNAGLAPILVREGRFPIFARPYRSPANAIKQAIVPSSVEWPQQISAVSLHSFLSHVCTKMSNRIDEIVIILDQFEEFFIFQPEKELRQAFIEDFAHAYYDKRLPIRFVLAIRNDYYSDFAEFQIHIPTIFYNEYRLSSMNRREVQQAITMPVAKLVPPIHYEQKLIETLIDDLDHYEIELPHMQIICTELFEDALVSGKIRIEMEQYEACRRATGILGNYLNDRLEKLPARSEAVSKEILIELVSLERTKCILSYNVLATRIHAKKSELDEVLSWLEKDRLLRRTDTNGEISYELVHEYLIPQIMEWIDKDDAALKRAQGYIECATTNWEYHSTLIPRDRLEVVFRKRQQLKHDVVKSLEAIILSAVHFDSKVEEWYQFLAKQDSERLIDATIKSLFTVRINNARNALLRELGKLWNLPRISDLGSEDLSTIQHAIKQLILLNDKRATKPILALLNNKVTTGEVITALDGLGKMAVEPLIEALEIKDPDIRKRVVWALGNTHDKRAVDPLIPMLYDYNALVCKSVVESLGRLGDKRAVEPLVLHLYDKHVPLRHYVIQSLGQLRDKRAVKPLIAALQDENYPIPDTVAGALGMIGDKRAVEPLIVALQDPNAKKREGASRALGQIGDKRAVKPLIDALQDTNESVRYHVVEALSKLNDKRIVEPLIMSLYDEYSLVRETAANTLGRIGDKRAIEPLMEMLENAKKDSVKWSAQQALKQLGCDIENVTYLNDGSIGIGW